MLIPTIRLAFRSPKKMNRTIMVRMTPVMRVLRISPMVSMMLSPSLYVIWKLTPSTLYWSSTSWTALHTSMVEAEFCLVTVSMTLSPPL